MSLCLTAHIKGVVRVKTLLSAPTTESFSLLTNQGRNIATNLEVWETLINNDRHYAKWERYDYVGKYAKHDTRQNYLKICILDRYFVNNEYVHKAF